MSVRAASRSSGVLTATISTPGSSRLAMPASTPPGASSTTAVTPRSRQERRHRSQRTGSVTWRTSRASRSRPVDDGRAVGVGQQDRARVGDRQRRGVLGQGVVGRRHVSGVERAGDLQGPHPGAARRLGRELLECVERSRRRRSARRRCGWPASARLPRCAATTATRVAAEHGGHAGRGEGAGGGHLGAATGGEARRPRTGRAHRRRRRRSARRRCGRRRRARRRRRGRAGRRRCTPSATSSGWVTAVSLISSASAVVPRRARSRPVTSENSATCSAHAGQLEPGGEHAGGLGALARSEDGDHTVHNGPADGSRRRPRHGQRSGPAFVGIRQSAAQVLPVMFGGQLSVNCNVSESAEHERDPQRQRAAGVGGGLAADLGHPPQPVADGVRVHEQGAGGRFQRAAGVEERGDGLDEHVAGVDERAVDVARPAGRGPRGRRPAPARAAGRRRCTGRGAPGQAGRRPQPAQGGLGHRAGAADVDRDRADDHRPVAEQRQRAWWRPRAGRRPRRRRRPAGRRACRPSRPARDAGCGRAPRPARARAAPSGALPTTAAIGPIVVPAERGELAGQRVADDRAADQVVDDQRLEPARPTTRGSRPRWRRRGRRRRRSRG